MENPASLIISDYDCSPLLQLKRKLRLDGIIVSDSIGDVDQILNPSRDLVLALPDVGTTGDYHVMVVLFMEGGGQFAPVSGVDYMAASGPVTLGAGQVAVELELMLVP